MSQFNETHNQYRLFFKNLTSLSWKPLTSPQLRVINFSVKRDLLTKQTSSFEVLQMAEAVENGDIVGMYDSFGTIVYLGIVTEIKDNTVYAEQILGIFDDNWIWNNPAESTLESTIASIIMNDFQGGNDGMVAEIFNHFDIITTSSTNQSLQTEEDRYVVNFMSYLFSLYEKYNIIVDFYIPYSDSDVYDIPKIYIGTPNFDKLQIGNNSNIFRNFNITTEVYETNRLIVYSESTGMWRGEWYTTTSGITDDWSALNRPQRTKTNIVWSDDNINIIKASNLRNQIYNHRIELDLVLKNKLLNFKDLNLGQEVDIYFNGDYYNTILTGYSFNMSDNHEDETIHLIFGLVRTSLTSKLFKRSKNES